MVGEGRHVHRVLRAPMDDTEIKFEPLKAFSSFKVYVLDEAM